MYTSLGHEEEQAFELLLDLAPEQDIPAVILPNCNIYIKTSILTSMLWIVEALLQILVDLDAPPPHYCIISTVLGEF